MARTPAASPTLADLADGRFAREPMKRRRQPDGSLRPEPDWSLASRYLMTHLFFNVLREDIPRNQKKGTLPSLDAEALERMRSPLAAALVTLRQEQRTLASYRNADDFVSVHLPDTPPRAHFAFNVLGFDGVERIFTRPGESLPLNLDKGARRAFITPLDTVARSDLDADTLALLDTVLPDLT